MAVKKKEVVEVVEAEKVVEAKSYQEQLNEVDAQITELQAKKKELAKLALKEINEAVVMPIAQLNAISSVGYEKAKKKFGESWVE